MLAYEPSASCVWVSVLTAVPTKRCTLSLRLPSIYSCCRFPLNIRVSRSEADLQSDSLPMLLCTLREHCYFPPLCLALVTSLNYAIISVLKSPLVLLGCQLHTSSTMSVVPSIITASLLGSPWPSPGAQRLQTIQWKNEWMSSNVSITVLTLRIILLFGDIFLAEWDFWVLIHQIINYFIFGVLRKEPWGGALGNLSVFYQSNKAHGLSSSTRTAWSGTTVPLGSLVKFFEVLWCVIWEEQESLLFHPPPRNICPVFSWHPELNQWDI